MTRPHGPTNMCLPAPCVPDFDFCLLPLQQEKLIRRLDQEFLACARRYGLPLGDFPKVRSAGMSVSASTLRSVLLHLWKGRNEPRDLLPYLYLVSVVCPAGLKDPRFEHVLFWSDLRLVSCFSAMCVW